MGKSDPSLTYERVFKTGRPRKAIVDGKQQCSTCREWKLLERFTASKIMATGYDSRCRECETKRRQEYHNSHLHVALRFLWRSHKKLASKRNARRAELSENSCITEDFLIDLWEEQKGRCAVTGVPMTHVNGKGYEVSTNVSIDRIDSNIGYTRENVRLVCKAVNYMKHVMSDRELICWCHMILNGPLNRQEPEHALP